MERVNVRNLDQIQEHEGRPVLGRFGSLLLLSVAGAAIATAALIGLRRGGGPAQSEADPLAELVAEQRQRGPASPDKLVDQDVSFPAILSDKETPPTALAAVRDERNRLVPRAEQTPTEPLVGPPPAGDSLPVVPLPAGALLDATSVTTQPRDSLTGMAAQAAKLPDEAALAPSGMDGGYQIQVASFKRQDEAEAFVQDLRKRGHRAFRQAAYVADRGLWHRVRIGPFRTRYEANEYRKKFEQTERMSPFVIDPDKVKQAEEVRAAKLAARIRKYGRE